MTRTRARRCSRIAPAAPGARAALALALALLLALIYAGPPSARAEEGEKKPKKTRAESSGKEAAPDGESEAGADANTLQGEDLRVRFRVKILEWYLRDQLDTGFTLNYLRELPGNNVRSIDASFPSAGGVDEGLAGFFDRIRIGPGQLEAAIQALERTEKLKVLSEPTLTVNARCATPAKVFTGQAIPYEVLRSTNGVLIGTTEFRDTGISLSISDTDVFVHGEDPEQRFVRLKFNVEVTRLGQFVPVTVDNRQEKVDAPQILSRKLNTTLFLPEHSPFIAGIIKGRSKVESNRGIPFLAKLPVVGFLFRSKSEMNLDTELIFLVTGEILWPSGPREDLAFSIEGTVNTETLGAFPAAPQAALESAPAEAPASSEGEL